MAQDLRKLFEEQREKDKPSMRKGHEDRFLKQLKEELPAKKNSSFNFLKIAAAVLLLLSMGFLAYQKYGEAPAVEPKIVEKNPNLEERRGISLGDLSPDLKKLETYYVGNISLELSKLEISDENEALIDSFMEQLDALNAEYKSLNEELNKVGPNDQTISALIQNLQLRLQLLQKLKKKLNQLKTSKNEQVETNTI